MILLSINYEAKMLTANDHQFLHYHQNEQLPLILTELTKHKGPGLGRTQKYGGLTFILPAGRFGRLTSPLTAKGPIGPISIVTCIFFIK
jgi:hypothetical protein